jgi:hypothetical protein
VKNPCTKDCERRKANCHSVCPDGIAYEEYIRERNKKIREAKAKDKPFGDYKRNERDKVIKHQRRSERK